MQQPRRGSVPQFTHELATGGLQLIAHGGIQNPVIDPVVTMRDDIAQSDSLSRAQSSCQSSGVASFESTYRFAKEFKSPLKARLEIAIDENCIERSACRLLDQIIDLLQQILENCLRGTRRHTWEPEPPNKSRATRDCECREY